MNSSLMTARESARYLRISYWNFLEFCKRGFIPHIRLGKRVLARREALDQWLTQREEESLRQAI